MPIDEKCISEFAREFGVTQRALRHYENMGLLKPIRIGTSRIYTFVDRSRVDVILRAKEAGFSLQDIKNAVEQTQRDDGQVDWSSFVSHMTTRVLAVRLDRLKTQKERLQGVIGDLEQVLKQRKVTSQG